MKEVWEPIKGYEGIYKVSNLGNVKSLGYIDLRGFKRYEKPINHNIDKHNYHRVGLTKNKKRKYYAVHRLVAEAFIPNPDNLPQVNHIDGDKSNNCVDNLEWCTSSENIKHAYKIGIKQRLIGKDNVKSKPILQFDLSGNLIARYESRNTCANKLGLSSSNIFRVCNGKRHTCGGFVFKYERGVE